MKDSLRDFFNWKNSVFYILLFLFNISLPYSLSVHTASIGIVLTFIIFLFLRNISYYLFAFVFFIVFITSVAFLPQAIWFGHPPATMIASLFETDLQESKEFFKSLPSYLFLIYLLYFIIGSAILYFGYKVKTITFPSKYNILIKLTLFVICLILMFGRPLKIHLISKDKFNFDFSRVPTVIFYGRIYNSIQEYHKLRKDFDEGIKENPSWQIISSNPPYKNYVLIIGESVRRDYMSIYNFPIENSPFLGKANGTIVEGFTATAPNTVASLSRMLMQHKDSTIIYANNIISLVEMANFETIWLSNQGFSGVHESMVSKIAQYCDKKYFSRNGDFHSWNMYDSVLLPVFDDMLNSEDNDKNKLFVIHLAGSHQDFETRLENPIHYDFLNPKMSAYLQTIEQTDKFIETVYEKLEAKSEPFSILYFSDHGLVTIERNNKHLTTVTHGYTLVQKSAFDIPLVILNSDDTEQKHIKINKSAFNFLDGYAHWLGIEEKSLSPTYSFTSTEPDSLVVFNHIENVPYYSLDDDPAILP